MREGLLLPGAFGAATKLSPKALRLYADQGLLPPAEVDPFTGYRYYEPAQIPRARLIVRLRELGLPLARVAHLVDLEPAARDAELQAWLAARRAQLDRHTATVDAIARADGGTAALAERVTVRARPERKLLYRQAHVRIDGLDPFIDETSEALRAHLRAAGLDDGGPLIVQFHAIVGRDGEGRVEVAVPFTGSAEPAGDLRLRVEPAGTEAYLPVPADMEDFPLVLRVYDAVTAWIADHPGMTAVDSPYEVWPGAGGARFDVVFPVAA
ncbi:MerR family transcriptional regulator [Actinorhabdospora filicis]|uniref:MerR family transcriptional regulator n=1 Tax=Actinorhabdospora filicis TaxID=1785913 RepID=A0A9W6SP88_9ACTN|nr:MerR family transcriptional regulator [Actinorhabdospora filicis]GLZ79509.1 MerR family transcriptional regulator [Actinorhabdospora filicis]